MSLFNKLNMFKSQNMLSGLVIGKVVDNNDPDKRGRLRIAIPGVTDKIPSNMLPWYNMDGGIRSTGEGVMPLIPKVGTDVGVRFYSGDIYSGMYVSTPVTAKYNPILGGAKVGADTASISSRLKLLATSAASFFSGGFSKNYPDRSGMVTDSGISITVDRKDNTVSVEHPSGASIVMNSDGSVVIATPKRLQVGGVENVKVYSGADIDEEAEANHNTKARNRITEEANAINYKSKTFTQRTAGVYNSTAPIFTFNGNMLITGNVTIGGNLNVGGCISSPCE